MHVGNVPKRKIDVLVLTDVQLGSIWTRTKLLNLYLSDIEPLSVVLLGNFFNTRTFNKFLFANAQSAILEKLSLWIKNGIPVFYVVGKTDAVFMNFMRLSMPYLKVCSSAYIENGKWGNNLFFTSYNVLPEFTQNDFAPLAKYITISEAVNNSGIEIHSEAIIKAPSWRKQSKVLELVGNIWFEKELNKKYFNQTQLEKNELDLLESKNKRNKIFVAILNDKPSTEPDIKKNSVERNQFFP